MASLAAGLTDPQAKEVNLAIPPALIAATIAFTLELLCCCCVGCVCLYAFVLFQQRPPTVKPSEAEKASLMCEENHAESVVDG